MCEIGRSTLIVWLLTVMLAALPANAHDLNGIILQRSLEADAPRSSLLQKATVKGGDQPLESIARRMSLWPNRSITSCFVGGSAKVRQEVIAAVTEWTELGLLTYDFGQYPDYRSCLDDGETASIRIGFSERGFWSYVGTDALYSPPKKPTLNLQGFDRKASFSERDRGVVRHEFGHALGFEHEHQHPYSYCEEQFDFSYIYSHISWDKEEVDANMRRLFASSAYLIGPYDPKSIMHYSLPREYFRKDITNAGCLLPENTTLSAGDRAGFRRAYALGQETLLSEDIDRYVAENRDKSADLVQELESLNSSRSRRLSEE